MPINGVIKHYDWGSTDHIPGLLGRAPNGQPHAELWLGAHRSGSAVAQIEGASKEIFELIAVHPEQMLGHVVHQRAGARLPFLMKILGIARPLSVQVHPTLDQARAGFERDNALGIPLNDPKRTYVDSYDKPELICALTEVTALCGFRPVEETFALLEPLADVLACEKSRPGENFLALYELPVETQDALLRALPAAVASRPDSAAWKWVARLVAARPTDISVLAPLYLNLVTLSRHEALYLDAGTIHAYLEGFGVEVMGSSDNVVRGGLTSKHVNLDELVNVLNTASTPARVISAERLADGWTIWPTDCEYFQLLYSNTSVAELRLEGPAIVLCVAGKVHVSHGALTVDIGKGESLFVAGDTHCTVRVTGEVYVSQINRHAALQQHGIAQ